MLYKESILAKVVRIVLSVAFCLFALIPIYAALIVALTPYSNMLEAQLVPHYFELSNFVDAFLLIYDNILNSFLYAASATLLTTAISVPAAYAIARYKFRFRKSVLFSLLLTQMMAGIVLLPTLYKTFSAMGVLDSPVTLILVYSAVNLALVVTIHHGYFSSLPAELDEAAAIDGCNYLQTLFRIIFPISGPGIAVGAIFVFIISSVLNEGKNGGGFIQQGMLYLIRQN